jgi:hypothetical protein
VLKPLTGVVTALAALTFAVTFLVLAVQHDTGSLRLVAKTLSLCATAAILWPQRQK